MTSSNASDLRVSDLHASDLHAFRDEEKQESPSNDTLDTSNGQLLVDWEEGHDPLNPQNFRPAFKWAIVTVVCCTSLLVTCASSVYSSTYEQLTQEFRCSQEVAILGLSLFVIGIACGPMLVSPLSEFYGRRPIYLVSMFLFVVFNVPCAAAQNIQTMLVGRFLDGIAGSAALTVSGGSIADLFVPSEIQAPMLLFTIMPFIGPAIGPVIGGFINQFTTWRWTFYFLIIWSGALLVCMAFVPETYHPVLLTRKAAALRKSTGNLEYRSASEMASSSKSFSRALMHSLYRPFQLLLLEPMCLCLDLYAALLLGVVYLFFGAFPLIFGTNHGFNLWQTGLTFLGLVVGMLLAAATHPLWFKNYQRLVAKPNAANPSKVGGKPSKPDPEFRLPPAIFGALLVPVGLFWFGWTTFASVHWIVPIIGSAIFMAGTFLAFSGIFTFLVDAYPQYAASALAGNTLVRCMFAAVFPLFGHQMYEKLGYQWATSLLAFLAVAMMPFPYLFFRYGKLLRARSRFAWT